MKITSIKWDVDMEDIYETLDEMTVDEASELLKVPVDTYANMSTEERHDYAYDVINHNSEKHYDKIAEIMGLPYEIDLDSEGIGLDIAECDDDEWEDAISDWLSDEYDWCHNGFFIEGDPVYEITVTDSATYRIRAKSLEDAQDKACEYFSEREPDLDCHIVSGIADDEV